MGDQFTMEKPALCL